jgi:hypothetical protein
MSEEPVPPSRLQPGLPRDLVTVCLKCLEKEPHKRYVSALALADDLGRFLEGKSIQARRAGLPERGWRWCRRNPALASAAGLAVAALMAVTAISITFAVAQFRSKAYLAAAYQDLSHELNTSQRLAAELALNTGQLIGEQGEPSRALLWVARSLKLAPADARELQSAIRINLGYWRTRINPLRGILRHDAEVWAVAMTPDRKTLLTGHPNGTVQFWDVATRKQISKQIGDPLTHPADFFAVAFSPDGKTVLTRGADQTVRLWNLHTGNPVGKLVCDRPLGRGIRTAAFSPDGKRVLIGYFSSREGSGSGTRRPVNPSDLPSCIRASYGCGLLARR